MSVRLTVNSFLQVLDRSGLLSEEDVTALRSRVEGDTDSQLTAVDLAAELVANQQVTPWQSEKLLQAKHRGFLLGDYQLLGILGRGGMSTVFVARHRISGEQRAIKVLPASRIGDSSCLARFQREARITTELNHPNIVRAFGLQQTKDAGKDVYFIILELIDGQDLSVIVARSGPLPVKEALSVIEQGAIALAHAHGAGLVHRDVKPGNLIRTDGDVVKLLDLGLANAQNDDDESLTRAFNERVLGTADYLSPEQAVDSHTIDHRSDIYSLGCTLYFLLTGQPPFSEGTLAQRILAHQIQQPESVTRFRQDVTVELVSLLESMMAKRAENRPQSAMEVVERIRSLTVSTAACRAENATAVSHSSDSTGANRTNSGSKPGRETSLRTDSSVRRQQTAAETLVATNSDTATSHQKRYCPELFEFLEGLDNESGVDQVMNSAFRIRQLRKLSRDGNGSHS